jgi:hypothetical protein
LKLYVAEAPSAFGWAAVTPDARRLWTNASKVGDRHELQGLSLVTGTCGDVDQSRATVAGLDAGDARERLQQMGGDRNSHDVLTHITYTPAPVIVIRPRILATGALLLSLDHLPQTGLPWAGCSGRFHKSTPSSVLSSSSTWAIAREIPSAASPERARRSRRRRPRRDAHTPAPLDTSLVTNIVLARDQIALSAV